MIVDGKLNLYVWMRSNDAVFGFSAVNLYNFTLMQQYVAKILGVPLGSYYHIADNFHYYENKKDLVEQLASIDLGTVIEYDRNLHNDYDTKIGSLDELDIVTLDMYQKEEEFWKLSNEIQFQGEESKENIKTIRSLLKNIKNNYPDPFFRGWLYAFPLAMKPIKKTVKDWLIKNGESENKMIAQFF